MLSSRVLYLALVLLLIQTCSAKRDRFQHWMPGAGSPSNPEGANGSFSTQFEVILADSCSEEYHNYLTLPGSQNENLWCKNTISCILNALDERTKIALSSSDVMLGLVAVILTLMGPSTAECALLAVKRPILALFIAAGSPSKSPTRSLDYWIPIEENMRRKAGRLRPQSLLSPMSQKFVWLLEWVVAGAAVANVYYTSWQLGSRTIYVPWCTKSSGPLLWAAFGIPIHLLGVWTFFLRAMKCSNGADLKLQSIWRIFEDELSLCGYHASSVLQWKNETYMFVVMAWLTSIASLIQILFCTLWFSSLAFISVDDALGVLARYLASAIACRAVLMLELSGLRETMEVEEIGEGVGEVEQAILKQRRGLGDGSY